MFRDLYRNKAVFLTGHTGFKGAWLSLWLAELGARVHGYSLEPPTEPNLFNEADVQSRLASHRIADVRDAAALAAAVRETQPQIVFHLAAQSLVRRSYREPRATYETNVLGTVNLLEAIRATQGVRVCQVITSDKCYENREWVYPYREVEPMGGADPYSSSKGCAELVVAAYRRSYFDPAHLDSHGPSLSSARAGNVIGGGDWAEDRVIPDCIRAVSQGKVIGIRNPNAIRPWQHVLEPLSGYLHLAAAQYEDPAGFAGAWNFGPLETEHLTVRDLVEEVIRQWGGGEWQKEPAVSNEAARPTSLHEATSLRLDVTKAMSALHWRPVLSVSEAVGQTTQWYRAQALGRGSFDAQRTCVEQIHAYMARAKELGLPWTQSGQPGTEG
jgi:CDP-glucose 4,6-dehydratase